MLFPSIDPQLWMIMSHLNLNMYSIHCCILNMFWIAIVHKVAYATWNQALSILPSTKMGDTIWFIDHATF